MIKRGLALFALLFIVFVYIIYPISNVMMGRDMESRLSPYADDYDDVSLFKEDIEDLHKMNSQKTGDGMYDIFSIIASPTILNGPDITPEKTLYISIGVEKKYSTEEIDALTEFLRAGGKAIFADDYGYISELARYFGVTYYRGKFFDNEFDRNENFTIVSAKMSVDQYTPTLPTEIDITLNETNTLMLNHLKDSPPLDSDGNPIDRQWHDKDVFRPDGIWDSDQDNDGRTDEDPPEKGTPIDDDMDKAKSARDGRDNDNDGKIDAEEDDPNEGQNEDQLDDDGDWIDLNKNGQQDLFIWYDMNGDHIFNWKDHNNNGIFDIGENLYTKDAAGGGINLNYLEKDADETINEYISGDYGVDEEIFDGIDNDGDSIIDEDLRAYRLLFNDATGMTTQGTRIIAHGGTSDPPSYVNLDDKPGANTPSVEGFSKEDVVDEISSPGSEIQLIVEVLICPGCGGAIDIRTGDCRDTTSEFKVKDPCHKHYSTSEYNDLGSAIFISDASLFLNDIYELDHLATNDATNEIYQIELNPRDDIQDIDYFKNEWNDVNEWDDAPHTFRGPSPEDQKEAQKPDESSRNYQMDLTPDGELDYDNKKFARDLIRYLLPEGGIVVFDESRHYQENEFLIPVYASLYTITFLTSDPWYSSALIIIFVLLLTFTTLVVKNKENWIHKHDINLLHGRKSLPVTRQEQMERLRWGMLNKARMARGLSPEEFQQLTPTDVNAIINDPQLVEVIRNQSRTYTDEELKVIMIKINKFNK